MQFQADTKRIGQGLKSGNTPNLLSFRRNDYGEECIFITTTSPTKKQKCSTFFQNQTSIPRSEYDCRHFPPKPIVSSNFELISSVATNDWGILIRVWRKMIGLIISGGLPFTLTLPGKLINTHLGKFLKSPPISSWHQDFWKKKTLPKSCHVKMF